MIINVSGVIGVDVQAIDIIKEIQATKDKELSIIILSAGGNAYEGLMVYDALMAYKQSGGKVYTKILGLAASAASVIFSAGDVREMGVGSLLMIHNSHSQFYGNKKEVAEQLNSLGAIDSRMADIYSNATGTSKTEIEAMIDSNKWFSAEEAVSAGFANSTVEAVAIAASLYKSTQTKKEPVKMATEKETKEAGFLSHMMAYFRDTKAEAVEPKAMEEEEEVVEDPKAMDEEVKEDEPKAIEEETDEPKAMEEEVKEDEKDKEIEALKAQLASINASVETAEARAEEEKTKHELIFGAVAEHKFTMFEAKTLASKSLTDVKAMCENTPANASGAGKTERPVQASAVGNKYDEWMSLRSAGKLQDAQAFYKINRNEILKDK